MQNENKLVHYESKGNWSDNLNNYGKFKCKGSLLVNKNGKRTDNELILCELEDVNGEIFTQYNSRTGNELNAGSWQKFYSICRRNMKNLLGKTFVYAVS